MRVVESRAPVGSSASTTAGSVDQRPGDRDPLLLAAGERAGQVPAAVAEADPVEQPADPVAGPGRRPARRSGRPTFCSAVR